MRELRFVYGPFARILFLGFVVVMIRSYMAYGIPTAWNKTAAQTTALFFAMGIGKGLGGVLADRFGAKRVALFSSLLAFPFLAAGNRLMYVSLFGILLFSMTMPITLGLIASVLNRAPGLAFGVTTIGLLFGCLPVFFFRMQDFYANIGVLGMLTIVAAAVFVRGSFGGFGRGVDLSLYFAEENGVMFFGLVFGQFVFRHGWIDFYVV